MNMPSTFSNEELASAVNISHSARFPCVRLC